MAALYAKDFNFVNYVGLTIGYFYLAKKVETFLIAGNLSAQKQVSFSSTPPSFFTSLVTPFIFSDPLRTKSKEESSITKKIL